MAALHRVADPELAVVVRAPAIERAVRLERAGRVAACIDDTPVGVGADLGRTQERGAGCAQAQLTAIVGAPAIQRAAVDRAAVRVASDRRDPRARKRDARRMIDRVAGTELTAVVRTERVEVRASVLRERVKSAERDRVLATGERLRRELVGASVGTDLAVIVAAPAVEPGRDALLDIGAGHVV